MHFIILILLFCGIDTFSFSLNVCDNCDSTEYLFMYENQLTGSIPDQVCALRNDASPPGVLSSLKADCSVCTAGTNCCTNACP